MDRLHRVFVLLLALLTLSAIASGCIVEDDADDGAGDDANDGDDTDIEVESNDEEEASNGDEGRDWDIDIEENS